MKNMRRKLLSLLLVMAMVCSMVPSALAAGNSNLSVTATPTSIKVGETSKLSVTGQQAGTNYSYSWSIESGSSVELPTDKSSKEITVTAKSVGETNIKVEVTETSASTTSSGSITQPVTLSATVTVTAADKPTISLSPSSSNNNYTVSTTSGTQVTAHVMNGTNNISNNYSFSWTRTSGDDGIVKISAANVNNPTFTPAGKSGSVTYTVNATPTSNSYTTPTAVSITLTVPASSSATVSALNKTTLNLSAPTTTASDWSPITATVAGLSSTAGYTVHWSSSDETVVTVSDAQNGTYGKTASTVIGNTQSVAYVKGIKNGTATISAILYDSSNNPVGTQRNCTVYVGSYSGLITSLNPNPSNSTTVYLNYSNVNGYYSRTFSVTPAINGSTNFSGYYFTYSWTLNNSAVNSNSSSTNYTSNCTISANQLYNYATNYNNTLRCTVNAYTDAAKTNLVDTEYVTWTVRSDYTYHNYGSISASATVYANSTGYSLGSTDDAGSTSIVSELQSAVSSRYNYGWNNGWNNGWNSDYFVNGGYDSSGVWHSAEWWRNYYGYDYNWGNGYYGYDTLRYVTFSSVSTTGGSLSASTGTRYHVGGYSSYGSSALENVVFTPNGKSSTASFNITAYGDYGTYSGTITFNMSGTATPTTLTMSGTAGQNLNFKASDFTSWWKGMYPSGNLSYVRFTSCSAGSLTNGVNGSSVVGNSTSCYASASGSQVAIGNLIYNSNSTGAATVTVNFTGYGSTTSSSSASTNRAGTLTITLAAGTPSVVSNLNVSYSCGASGVNLNATTFYNAVSASVTTASYITLGSPSSGTLTQNGVNVTSGSRFVLSGTSNNIGDVLYKPSAGFNGTATIPFVAYNSSNQTVATGSISIAVTQAAAPTTPGKTFPDTANHWSNTYVSVLASAGIVGGYDDGKFHPEREMTYGEALKLILLAAGYPEQAQGSGTNWAVNYLTLAINNGILPGSASSYTLSATVDRNTIAAMTAKALKLSPVTDTSTSPFVDSKDPYVLALNKAGIIFGDSSSGAAYYQGEKAFNRGEAAAIIYRIYNYRA